MANGNHQGPWKMLAGCALSALVSATGVGFMFRLGIEGDTRELQVIQHANSQQIQRLSTAFEDYVERQAELFRAQTDILVRLNARFDAYLEAELRRQEGG